MGGNVVLALDVEGHGKPHRGVIATGDARRLWRNGRIETRAPSLVVIEPKSCPAPQLAAAENFSPTASRLSRFAGVDFCKIKLTWCFAVAGRRVACDLEGSHPRAERREEDGHNSEGERASRNDARCRGVRAARLSLRDGACAAGGARRHHHRGGMLRHLRRRLESVRRGAFLLGRRQGPARLHQGADDPGPRVRRHRRRARREHRPSRRVPSRRAADLGTDRSLRRMPLLQERPVLDVRAPRRLRLPEQRQRRDGEVHAPAGDLAHPQGAERACRSSARR